MDLLGVPPNKKQSTDDKDETPTVRSVCALISGHMTRYLLPENRLKVNDICIGQIMDPPWQSEKDLDIAAAIIDETFASQCDKMFKDDKGKGKLCKLYDSGSNNSSFLPTIVHCHGPQTGLGFGEIFLKKYSLASCNIRNEQEDGKLMLLTDRTPFSGEPFCKLGDSGAIICANDKRGKYVHIIAMLMGKMDSRNSDVNHYLAVQLKSGLEQMGKRYNLQFKLCDGHVDNT